MQQLRRISPYHAPLINYEFGLSHLGYILHSDLNLTGKYAQPNSHSAGCWVLPFSGKQKTKNAMIQQAFLPNNPLSSHNPKPHDSTF